jgi:hypothetical protein
VIRDVVWGIPTSSSGSGRRRCWLRCVRADASAGISPVKRSVLDEKVAMRERSFSRPPAMKRDDAVSALPSGRRARAAPAPPIYFLRSTALSPRTSTR